METTAPEVIEQDVPVGGSVAGDLPGKALATLPVGIVTVREVPALGLSAGTMTLTAGSVQRLGRDPLRRRVTVNVVPSVGADVDTVVWLGTNEQQARGAYGFALPRGRDVTFNYGGELWFALPSGAAVPATVTFFMEIDAALDANG